MHHDFVASASSSVALRRDGSRWVGDIEFAPPTDAVAVAVWQIDGGGQYVQATGSWL